MGLGEREETVCELQVVMSTRQKPARALPGSRAQATAGRTSVCPGVSSIAKGGLAPRHGTALPQHP